MTNSSNTERSPRLTGKLLQLSWDLLRVWVLWGSCFAALFLIGLWSVGAVRYAFHWPPAMTAVYAGILMGVWICALRRKRLLFILCPLLLVVLGVFLGMTPERMFAGVEWQAPWGRVPTAEFREGSVLLRNVRDFEYRSVEDYTVRYVNFEIDISTVRTVDIALSHWDGLQVVAHTMLSFGFADGRQLVASMETRLPKGAEQGFLPGFYHQYELMMILGTEEDLFELRTDFRKEELFLYRTNATPEQARELLKDMLEGANSLARAPEFYNSVTRNCTTSLAPLLRVINPGFSGDIRLLCNGHSDELLFELGYLDHRPGESFAELKARRAAERNLALKPDGEYSERLRADL